MRRLLYFGIGGLILWGRSAEFFRYPQQVRAGLRPHFMHDLTALHWLRCIGKEGKSKSVSPVQKRIAAWCVTRGRYWDLPCTDTHQRGCAGALRERPR